MWYYDPFTVMPVLWGSVGLLAFVIMILLAKKGRKLASRILAAIFAASTSACAFSLTLAWLLNNQEKAREIETWILAIFS